jgi:quinol monooxygenase YgiN
MSVMVLLEAPVRSEEVSHMKSYLAEILPETRVYEGCRAIDVYFNGEDTSRMVMIEHWSSRTQHKKYVDWRTETGVMGKIGGMLAGPPSIRYFDRVDA